MITVATSRDHDHLHGALVDLLSALPDHHRASFDRLASPTGAADKDARERRELAQPLD